MNAYSKPISKLAYEKTKAFCTKTGLNLPKFSKPYITQKF